MPNIFSVLSYKNTSFYSASNTSAELLEEHAAKNSFLPKGLQSKPLTLWKKQEATESIYLFLIFWKQM